MYTTSLTQFLIMCKFTNICLKYPISDDFSYAPIVEGNWFQDYPSILMNQGKFVAVPTLIGHTTAELSTRIPTFVNFASDRSILDFTGAFVSYTPPSTLQAMLDLFPASNYTNIGPPGSGSQWSRVVDIDNYLQSFCPVQAAASQISAKGAPVWKCKLCLLVLQKFANDSYRSLGCTPFNLKRPSVLWW